MKTNFFTDKNEALNYLLDKYQVNKAGEITESGCLEQQSKEIPLLPWRIERRFVELKNLIKNRTLEDVSTFRFAHLAPANDKTLDELIYQELDLCEWLGGAPVSRLFAVFSGEKAVNIIVKLKNDLSCSVECSVMLPDGAAVISRHEIIARRGVASDQVVDTQVPQSSIYTYTAENEKRFTDVDAEIFGLSQGDVNLVRGAFKVLNESETAEKWTKQHRHLLSLVEEAKKSEINSKASIIEGGKQL
ncbi:MAG: hypothetical protein PHS31_05380 [Victivallaceae bacterium]|nr:hypothetical protein [Victivallaceae bacterium]MDD4180707.1 hypothetical protein [Victivallaceae bacterium]